MVELLADFGTTALLAGIALAVSALWEFFRGLLTGPHGSTRDLIVSIAISLALFLLAMALPVLLVLLYRTGIRAALSRKLRFAAGALVVIEGAAVLFDIREMWRPGMLSVARHAALTAERSQSWFFLSPAGHWWFTTLVVARAANLASGLAFLLFLVALTRQAATLQNADERASRQVRNAALIATFVGVLLIIALLINFQVYAHVVRTYGPAGMPAFSALPELRSLLFALPEIIAPWIILVGVIRQCGRISEKSP